MSPSPVRLLNPDISVPVGAACHNPVRLGRPVDPGDPQVVLVQDGKLLPPLPVVEDHVPVTVGKSHHLTVRGPGVALDRTRSKLLNGSCH